MVHGQWPTKQRVRPSIAGAALLSLLVLSGGTASAVRVPAQGIVALPASTRTPARAITPTPPSTTPTSSATLAVKDHALAFIAAHLGPLKVPVLVITNATQPAGSVDYGYANSSANECVVHVNPPFNPAAPEALSEMAHELFHCYEYQMAPSPYSYSHEPKWLNEGAAQWVGLSAGPNPSQDDTWDLYLTQPSTPLFERSYDAVGFFAHLAESGFSPWDVFPGMFAVGNNSVKAFEASGAASDRFLDSWASGFAREPNWGQAWDTTGPGITSAKAQPLTYPVSNTSPPFTRTVKQASDLDVIIDVTADETYFDVPPHGLVHFYNGGNFRLSDIAGKTFCTRAGGCECRGEGPPPFPRGLAYLAVAAWPGDVTVTIRGHRFTCNPALAATTTSSSTTTTTAQGGFKNCGTVAGAVNKALPEDVPGRNLYTVEAIGAVTCAFATHWTALLTATPPTAGEGVHDYPLVGPPGWVCSGTGGGDSSTFAGSCARGSGYTASWVWGDNTS